MRYTGLNPNGINQVASGSVAISVENTRVATFGTNTLQVTGSTLISGSLNVIGTSLVTGSTILSGSLTATGPFTNNGNTVITGSLTVVTGSSIELQVTNLGVRIGNVSTDSHTITGSLGVSGSISTIGSISSSGTLSLVSGSAGVNIAQSLTQANSTSSFIYGVNVTPTLTNNAPSQTQTAFRVNAVFTGSYTGSSTSNIIADFGASSVGSQLTITDVTSGSIYMVNDVSGLPIIEATSDWSVNMYNYPSIVFRKTGSALLLGVSGSTGSLVTVQASSSFTAPASFTQPTTFRNDIIFNEGVGATYTMLQVSASTAAAANPTASLYTLGLNTSSSVSMIALITGYGTGSRDTVTGEIRSTIKRVGGNASIVGTNIRFITADFSGSDANIVVSGSNAILVVTGSTAEPYAWRATITTQIV
jgi:fibronectin-binding autotransporter adhesin